MYIVSYARSCLVFILVIYIYIVSSLTLTSRLSSGPRAVRLASSACVTNKFVPRITLQCYCAPVGECISIYDAISWYTGVATVNN